MAKKPSLDAFRSFSIDSDSTTPTQERFSSRRDSIASSVRGAFDFPISATTSRLPPVAEGSQNAIATLLQPPIIRTGLLPSSAPAGSRMPNTKDIPPVTLTNIPSIDTSIFRPYISQVGNLYESRARAEERPLPPSESGTSTPKDPLSPRISATTSPITEIPPAFPRRRSSGGIRRGQLAVPPLNSIPNVYFDQAFHLENPRIFDVVTERSEVIRTPITENGPDPNSTPRKALATNAILQEKLSWYLDTVEIHLISAISTASRSFFAALGSLKELHKEASDSVSEIQKLRADLKHLDQDMAMGRLELVRLNQRRQNVYKLACATQQLQNVIRAKAHCEDLVDAGEFESALEKIGILQDYSCGYFDPDPAQDNSWLSTEPIDHLIDLRKIQSLEGFGRAMNQLREKVGIGYQYKFTEILLSDLRAHVNAVPANETLNRWASTGQKRRGIHARSSSSSTVEPLSASSELRSKLSATLLGLKRSKYTLAATAAFKDAVNKEMKRIIRQNLPSASDDDNESMASTSTRSSRITLTQSEKSALLARNLRALGPQDAEELFTKAYCGIGEALRRLQFLFKLLLDLSSDESIFRSPVRKEFGNNLDVVVNGNGLRSPSPNLQEELIEALDLSSALGQAVDVAQSQLIKVLKVRSEQAVNLDLRDFLRYFTLNKLFADDCEAISGRSGASLKGVINNQISDFIVKFAETERIALADAMDRDKWDAKEFSPKDEIILNNILQCRDADPPGFLRLAYIWEDEADQALNSSDHPNQPTTNGTSTPTLSTNGITVVPTPIIRPAIVEDDSYILPLSAILLLHGLSRFLTLIACMPAITSEVSLSLLDYLKLFNSKLCQLVLGAGATRSAARLEKINTKHLALASQALAFSVAIVPYLREFVRRKPGVPTQAVAEYDRVRRLLTEHMVSIHDKLVEIMATRAGVHVAVMDGLDWDADASLFNGGRAGATRHMETAIKETASLQRALAKHMPEASVRGIVQPVFENYREIWGDGFGRARVRSAVGKERLVRDAETFLAKLGGLYGGKEVGEFLVSIARGKVVDGGAGSPATTTQVNGTVGQVNGASTADSG